MKSQTANDVLIFKEKISDIPIDRLTPARCETVVEKRDIVSSPKIALIWLGVALIALTMHIGGIEFAKWLVGLVWGEG